MSEIATAEESGNAESDLTNLDDAVCADTYADDVDIIADEVDAIADDVDTIMEIVDTVAEDADAVQSENVTPTEDVAQHEEAMYLDRNESFTEELELADDGEVFAEDPEHVSNAPATNASVMEETSVVILESLQTLLQRFDQLDGRLDGWEMHGVECPGIGQGENADADPPAGLSPEHTALQEDYLHLQSTLDEAWRTNEELRHQNEMLAAQVAESNVSQTVKASSGNDDSLSWEERKALIMRQMEEDTFDADEFVSSLSSNGGGKAVVAASEGVGDAAEPEPLPTPQEFVESLVERAERAERSLLKRDEEIGELRMLLENQSGTRDDGTAIGAAAIASMIDSDELVMEERERLQQLKNDWEDKFRQAEIEASLERAKLSRERQELAKRAQELEERLEELQREKRDNAAPAKTGRRWLAELGLVGDSEGS
ncbi:hypothetical protein [Rhodopirellula sallentina]|uniref:hypothetical protein n=1 Tax=Rhodopirellula sallentina TaxID=1263869 RepID=UPI001F44C17F|nr:hypothetical protein [Rhodopirellula sallentina]